MGRYNNITSETQFRLAAIVFISALGISVLPCALADDHYAAQNGQAPSGDYTTWASAASNIQNAVNAATANDTVWVGAGRYRVPTNAVDYIGTNVVYINKTLTLRSSNGVPATTIIDGGGTNRGVAVFYSSFTLDGLTISNCYATNMGGGVLFNADNAGTYNGVVQNCVISDNIVGWGLNTGSFGNNAGSRGGGIGVYSFTIAMNLTVSNCVISGNRALSGPLTANKSTGGGIAHAGQGLAILKYCSIENNSADGGGGVYVYFSTLQADNCVIRGNLAKNASGSGYPNGGGMYLCSPGRSTGVVWVRNCLICNNVAYGSGGGILYLGAYTFLAIYNSTIVSNTITSGGGSGIYAKQNTAGTGPGFTAYNSIIYSNSPDNYQAGSTYTATNVWFTNCCINPTNTAGSEVVGLGNITNSPQFVDFAGQSFRLTPSSPCVNRGINQDWMTNAVDFDGRTRIRYGTVDIGAYEVIYGGTIYGFH